MSKNTGFLTFSGNTKMEPWNEIADELLVFDHFEGLALKGSKE